MHTVKYKNCLAQQNSDTHTVTVSNPNHAPKNYRFDTRLSAKDMRVVINRYLKEIQIEAQDQCEETLVTTWLNTIGFNKPVCYKFDHSNKRVMIFTNDPDTMVGHNSTNVHVFRQMVNGEFGGEWRSRVVGITGKFVNV